MRLGAVVIHHCITSLRNGTGEVVKSPEPIAKRLESALSVALPEAIVAHRNRFDQPFAETNIGNMGLIEIDVEHQLTAEHLITPLVACHTARDAHAIEADLLNRPTQQPVHLVTPTAALPMNDLLENPLDVQVQRTSKLRIEVFVRELHLCPADFGQAWASAHATASRIPVLSKGFDTTSLMSIWLSSILSATSRSRSKRARNSMMTCLRR